MGKILRCSKGPACQICGLCREHCLGHNLRALRTVDRLIPDGFAKRRRIVEIVKVRNSGLFPEEKAEPNAETCAQLYTHEKKIWPDGREEMRIVLCGRSDSGPVKESAEEGRKKARERRAEAQANVGGVQ